jgi:hypothetical protein
MSIHPKPAPRSRCPVPRVAPPAPLSGALLDKGWVIANHIFMSVHAAFLFPYYIDRILATAHITVHVEILPRSFPLEVVTGLIYAFLTFYIAVGWHERGHYLEAVRQLTLNGKYRPDAQRRAKEGLLGRLLWNIQMLLEIPAGRFKGINKLGLTYSVDSPYNLAVAAAGPRASRDLFLFSIPFAVVLLVAGYASSTVALLYAGRIFLGVSVVALLDFALADAGEYRKFQASLKPVPPIATEPVAGRCAARWRPRVFRSLPPTTPGSGLPGGSATAPWAAPTRRRNTPSPTSACRKACSYPSAPRTTRTPSE